MTTLGSSLDEIEIIKDKNIITIIETYSNQQYSGLGHAQQAALITNSNIAVYNKQNIQVSIVNDTIIIKSNCGTSHSFNYNNILFEGFNASDALTFAQELLK